MSAFLCDTCNTHYSNKSNLHRHIRTVHNIQTKPVSYDKNVWNFKCLEENCNNSYQQNNGLIAHLEKTHNLRFQWVTTSVKNMNEFLEWKLSIELENHCSYIFKSTWNSANGEAISYYNCNRSGTGKGQRRANKRYKRGLKRQGTCKMNSSCTSQIRLISKPHGLVIRWQKVHYGHDTELQHIRLPQIHRQIIASKLICGHTPMKILETTRNNVGKKLKRLDLLTMRDIRNIKNSFKIEVGEEKTHDNDDICADLWMEECDFETSEQKPVLFSKSQDESENELEKNDFCFEIMNISEKEDPSKELDHRGVDLNTDLHSDLETVELETDDFTIIVVENDWSESKDELKDMINSTFYQLQHLDLKTLEENVIQKIHHHLSIVSKLISEPQSHRESQLILSNEGTDENNMQPQLRFSTTNKKGEARNISNQRLTRKDGASNENILTNKPELIISTLATFDHEY